MAGKLLREGFMHTGPDAQALSDPLSDTPIVVTLDELRPYELNPRLTRNPLYDEIKTSIRERGLDAPPPITRRPGAEHYIIRNGGNTRLSILRELWSETKDERFFRFPCLFRPWPSERGEIVALTGHLAENELHGGLTFIERALGVEKARELYEQESGQSLTQSELAQRLSADGYPAQQQHISRMQSAVRYLLPAIPNVLYGGLGRPQVERLVALRKAGELSWEKHAQGQSPAVDYETLFHEVLSPFDLAPAEFSLARVQDELIGQMAKRLGVGYNLLDLEIGSSEDRRNAFLRPPGEMLGEMLEMSMAEILEAGAAIPPAAPPSPRPPNAALPTRNGGGDFPPPRIARNPTGTRPPAAPQAALPARPDDPAWEEAPPQEPVVSPAADTERLQAIQRMVAEHVGDAAPDCAENVPRAFPIQVGGLYPITDLWRIEPGLDTPERLRIHIAQFAREIAEEAGLAECVTPVDDGIGFACASSSDPPAEGGRALLDLLHLLSGDSELGALLRGRLSDAGLVKLFRILRLARRLRDIETGAPGC
jgi:ParB family protein of integrating conjugative element (PFGI_1 class)